MAACSSRRVSFAEAPDCGVAAEPPHLVAATDEYDPHPQPAACGHSVITASEVPAAADEPEHDSDEEGGEKSTESSGHSRHVQDNPLEGTSAPSPAHCAASFASKSLTCRARPATPLGPFLTRALQTAYRSQRRSPRAREAHTGIDGR